MMRLPAASERPIDGIRQELAEVQHLLDHLGSDDGDFLYHVVQTLLTRPTDTDRPAVALLVARAIAGTVPARVTAFAAAVQIVYAASLCHRRLDHIDIGEAPASRNDQLTVLAGDYLYAQAALITANLQQLRVMSLLASTIKVLCEAELTGGIIAPARSPGLFCLSAVGSGHLLECDAATIAALYSYGSAMDEASTAHSGHSAHGLGIASSQASLDPALHRLSAPAGEHVLVQMLNALAVHARSTLPHGTMQGG